MSNQSEKHHHHQAEKAWEAHERLEDQILLAQRTTANQARMNSAQAGNELSEDDEQRWQAEWARALESQALSPGFNLASRFHAEFMTVMVGICPEEMVASNFEHPNLTHPASYEPGVPLTSPRWVPQSMSRAALERLEGQWEVELDGDTEVSFGKIGRDVAAIRYADVAVAALAFIGPKMMRLGRRSPGIDIDTNPSFRLYQAATGEDASDGDANRRAMGIQRFAGILDKLPGQNVYKIAA